MGCLKMNFYWWCHKVKSLVLQKRNYNIWLTFFQVQSSNTPSLSVCQGSIYYFLFRGEREMQVLFLLLKRLPTLILSMFVMPSSFISSANSARSPPFLWKAEARYFHCCNSFNSTQPRWTLKVNAAVITGDFEQYSPRNSSPEHLLDLNPFGSLFFFLWRKTVDNINLLSDGNPILWYCLQFTYLFKNTLVSLCICVLRDMIIRYLIYLASAWCNS